MEFIARAFWQAEIRERDYTAKADHIAAARQDFESHWANRRHAPEWLFALFLGDPHETLRKATEKRLSNLGRNYEMGGDTPLKRRAMHVQTILNDLSYVQPDTIVGLESADVPS